MQYEGPLLKENATVKILEWFSRNPSKKVYVNELSRTIDISNASCSRILNLLERKGLLTREVLGKAHFYQLKDDFLIREMKRFFLLLRLHESDLIENILENNPSLTNLVLYGSCATGKYDERSDLDLLAISNNKVQTDLERFQKALGIRIEITSLNIGRWLSMKGSNDGFYQEVKKVGVVLLGGELP